MAECPYLPRPSGASGGGTYTLENLTDTLGAGRFKGQLILP